MIARSFKSVAWVGAVGSAALGCYMVSLQVATERAELARVEAAIIAAKQDIRSLQTELGTRGRLSQLEHWNAEVLALSAPSSQQFVEDAFTLARLDQTEPDVGARAAEVHMASANAGAAAAPGAAPASVKPPAPVVRAVAPAPAPVQPALVHRASFTETSAPPRAEAKPEKPKAETAKTETARAEKPKAEPRKPAPLDGLKAEIAAARAGDGSDGN